MPSNRPQELPVRRILMTWWPLAASWLIMGIELPAMSAVIARLANPEINLAAFGGVIYPIALIVEAPILMLLAGSTALSRDWPAYTKVRQFMLAAGACLTVLHLLVAFTPLYYWVVGKLIAAPPEVVEPARIGLMIMVPWTWSIAYRRFNQGVLIRFGHSRAVGFGTLIRLAADSAFLIAGYLLKSIPGAVVASAAITFGVMVEAAYASIVVRPVLKNELRLAPPASSLLTWQVFFNFYIPLALTSLLSILAEPIGSAALSRMPDPLSSLAVWPVVSGLIFMLQSLGIAYNEVVVALLDQPLSSRNLRRFAMWLVTATTCVLLLIAVSPLSRFWFASISALPPHLVILARNSIWIGLPMPALSVLQSWFQGLILHDRRTRGISESVIVFLTVSILILGGGALWSPITGLYVGLAAFTLSTAAQICWLWYRSQRAISLVLDYEKGLLSGTPSSD